MNWYDKVDLFLSRLRKEDLFRDLSVAAPMRDYHREEIALRGDFKSIEKASLGILRIFRDLSQDGYLLRETNPEARFFVDYEFPDRADRAAIYITFQYTPKSLS